MRGRRSPHRPLVRIVRSSPKLRPPLIAADPKAVDCSSAIADGEIVPESSAQTPLKPTPRHSSSAAREIPSQSAARSAATAGWRDADMSAALALRTARAVGIRVRIDGDDLELEAAAPPRRACSISSHYTRKTS